MASNKPDRPDHPDEPEASDVARTEIPGELPGMRLASTVVFPYDVVSVQIDRPRSRAMLDAHPGDDRLVACFMPREPESEPAHRKQDFLPVGVACRVIHRMRMPNETLQIVLQGLGRIRLDAVLEADPWLRFRITALQEREPKGADTDVAIFHCLEQVDRLVAADGGYPPELVSILRMNIAGAGRFADLVGAHLRLPLEVKRHLLATVPVRDRLRIVEDVLAELLGAVDVRERVAERVRTDLSERQRKQLLRAQLDAIHRELGLGGTAEGDVAELRERIEARGLPEAVAGVALREADRLATLPPAAGEHHVSRSYIEWILDLPWQDPPTRKVDLARARAVLDAAHYGLEEVKERILEHLAVQRLRGSAPPGVLCLVGPPGVGKTSLGASIAEAMGRSFLRFSVGGVRDEAEIRGHRRTYVGAMPGKILQALRRAEARDPVFLVDEIDKMGTDARGDPASAMLEVLDPTQNAGFVDHYLDLPFDLSAVFFVCTANDASAIPGPLRDRMELVYLSGYTRLEKVEIAKRHLVPQVLADSGLGDKGLSFADDALLLLVDRYTREAGVRELKRQLTRIARRRALALLGMKSRAKQAYGVGAPEIETALGPPPHAFTLRSREPVVGVATGLGWTPHGGELLFVEASLVPGNGRVRVTGRLGDVMRESAEAAFSFLRSIAADLDIDPARMTEHDVHIHVPDGATPKDGPSAGVTIATCLASLYTGRPARPDVAMTGEITLKGRVLPVGGIKEKLLAAHRAGIQQVLLPADNQKDLHDLPAEVRSGLRIAFTQHVRENIDTALLAVFLPEPPPRRTPPDKAK